MSKDIAEALRAEIKLRGLSAYALAKATGVAQTAVSAFIRGGELRTDSASKIAAFLDMEMKRRKQ